MRLKWQFGRARSLRALFIVVRTSSVPWPVVVGGGASRVTGWVRTPSLCCLVPDFITQGMLLGWGEKENAIL